MQRERECVYVARVKDRMREERRKTERGPKGAEYS